MWSMDLTHTQGLTFFVLSEPDLVFVHASVEDILENNTLFRYMASSP